MAQASNEPVYRVVLANSGFSCQADESVLAAITRQGIGGVAVGCRGGGCGVCRVRVLAGRFRSGKIARCHVSPDELQAGLALACRLYPLSDLIIAAAPPSHHRFKEDTGYAEQTASHSQASGGQPRRNRHPHLPRRHRTGHEHRRGLFAGGPFRPAPLQGR